MSRRRSLSDRGAVALALGALAGALAALPIPPAAAALVVVVAWLAGRPVLFALGVAGLASGLGAHAIEAARPVPTHQVSGVATLVSDPVGRAGSVSADIRLDGERYELEASGAAMGVVRARLAGERLHVEATVRPRPPDAPWLLRRHVVGRVEIDSADHITFAGDGDPASALVNRYRRLLTRGAESLEPGQRALFTGFVFGDDRDVPAPTRFDFRASGLSHLLAVSGANVAFVLALAGPLLRRLGLRSRFVVAVGVLVLFALLTRFEPSVLRATAMALVAIAASTLGLPVAAIRVLALAVTALVLIDPLLAGSLAFQLSVAASAGIVLLARPIAAHLPGPRALADAAGVAVAAQIAVAPLLVPAFGGVPVASVPANLLAAPAAGPVMVWGLTAGTLAGAIGGPIATALHLPTRALLWWVDAVARRGAAVALGDLGPGHVALAIVVVAFVVAVELDRLPVAPRRARRLAAVAVVLVVASAVMGRPVPEPGVVALTTGATLTAGDAGGAVLVVDGRVRADDLLTALRSAGVRRVDVLVVRTDSRSAASVAHALRDRLDVGLVLAPSRERLVGAVIPEPGSTFSVGGLDLQVVAVGDSLEVSIDVPIPSDPGVRSAGARSSRVRVPDHPGARGPPLRHHAPRRDHGHRGPPLPVRPLGRSPVVRPFPGHGRGTAARRRGRPRRGR